MTMAAGEIRIFSSTEKMNVVQFLLLEYLHSEHSMFYDIQTICTYINLITYY